MANQIDPGKEANPMEEIFAEMFTLLQDLETRSVAVLEYLREQGGVGDEKLAPYLDRAAAASDVRWRAARARMDHLLAPKPKSATDVGKVEKPKGEAQPHTKEKGAEGSTPKMPGQQTERDQEPKPDSKGLGRELVSAQSGRAKSNKENKDESKDTKTASDATPSDKSEKKPNSSEESRATRPDEGKSANHPTEREKPQTQKATK